MSSGPEKNVENAIREELRKRGGWVIKIFANEFQGVGNPDLLVCYKGHFLAFETKAPGGRTKNVQKATLRNIARAGGCAISVRSIDVCRSVLDHYARYPVEVPAWQPAP